MIPPSCRDLRAILLALTLLVPLATRRACPGTLPFSLKIAQTIDTDFASLSAVSFDSSLLDGNIAWKADDVADALDVARSPPQTWSARLKPLSGVSILAGSVSGRGLPARAFNAPFSVSSPFREPLEADGEPMLVPGTTRQTKTLAAEIRSGAFDAAAFVSRPDDGGDVAWLCCSSTWKSFSRPDANFALAAFSGTRAMRERSDDPWIVDVPDAPDTRLSVSGGEFAFRLGEIGGSVTALANATGARAISAMGRGEAYVAAGPILLSSGYFRSDRDFRELDGTPAAALSRSYFSPQLRTRVGRRRSAELRLGAIASHDVRAGEKYWYPNEDRYSGGVGISLEAPLIAASSRLMATGETFTASASVRIPRLLARSLRLSLGATAAGTLREAGTLRPESVDPRAALSWTAIDKKRATLRMLFGYKGTIDLPDAFAMNRYSLAFEQTFLDSISAARIALEASLDAATMDKEGRLSIAFELR